MYKNEQEIKVVPEWRDVWWNLDANEEFRESVTGTPWKPLPRLQQRHIQNIYGKQVHVCGGEIELLTRDCEQFHVWIRCKKCGREFLAEI